MATQEVIQGKYTQVYMGLCVPPTHSTQDQGSQQESKEKPITQLLSPSESKIT